MSGVVAFSLHWQSDFPLLFVERVHVNVIMYVCTYAFHYWAVLIKHINI